MNIILFVSTTLPSLTKKHFISINSELKPLKQSLIFYQFLMEITTAYSRIF